jgi:malonyl-CoA O-methyltransferase
MGDSFSDARNQIATREGYDQWASVYDTDGNPLIALEEPRVAELLGDTAGLRIADIGCGTGRHAIRLAAAAGEGSEGGKGGGGAEVTAVDFSEGMLAKARAKPGAERVGWVRHDLGTRLPLESGAFDRVLCALVLDHIADCRGLFAEFARLVKPAKEGGRVVVSAMHPAMMLRGVQARFNHPETGEKVHVESVRNQISDYVMAAMHAGLTITHMSEHVADAALVAKTQRAEQHVGWPMLLMMGMERRG